MQEALIGGGCASGMLMRMGEGYLMQWVAMLGFLAGSAFGAWNLGWWIDKFMKKAPVIFLPDSVGWPCAVTAQLALLIVFYILALIHERGWERFKKIFKGDFSWKDIFRYVPFSHNPGKINILNMIFKKPWPYLTGGIMLALLNVALFTIWRVPWGITSGITYFSGWISSLMGFSPEKWAFFKEAIFLEGIDGQYGYSSSQINYFDFPLMYHFLAIIGGSFLSSLLAGEFRLRKWRSGRFIWAGLSGGFLMGYGSRLALGCNIGAFFSAIPSFSLHGWVFGMFVLAGSYLGGKILIKYLII